MAERLGSWRLRAQNSCFDPISSYRGPKDQCSNNAAALPLRLLWAEFPSFDRFDGSADDDRMALDRMDADHVSILVGFDLKRENSVAHSECAI